MNDERLRQRIAYLVENGVVDDPLDVVSKRVQRLTWLVVLALGADAVMATVLLA
jgi:hypothetical protein